MSAAVSNQLEVVPEHLVAPVELTPQLVHNVSLGVLHKLRRAEETSTALKRFLKIDLIGTTLST